MFLTFHANQITVQQGVKIKERHVNALDGNETLCHKLIYHSTEKEKLYGEEEQGKTDEVA